MYKNNKFLAVIPARGGSKGIKKKNIYQVFGKPLIAYTIEEARKSKYIDRCLVSTDDKEIAKISKRYGADVPFLRSSNLANDNSKTIDALIEVIDNLKDLNDLYDYIIVLQPTQPLRRSFHIDESIEEIINNEKNCIVSVSEVNEHPILMRTINNGILENLLSMKSTVRRQDFPEYYKINGAIYINKIDSNFNSNLSLNDNNIPYVMDSIYDLDIDEPIDIEFFKYRYRLMKSKE